MANLRNIALIGSVIDETRKTQRDLASIRNKKAERQQADELFKLKKRNIESQIKARESSGAITPLDAKGMMAEFKDFSAALKSQSDLDNGILDQAQTQTMNKQKKLSQITRQIMPSLTISTDVKGRRSSTLSFRTQAPKQLSSADKFSEGFRQAESGLITFDELGKQFPGKRKEIREQRIEGLPNKSRALLGQIAEVQAAEVKQAVKNDSKPRSLSETVSEFLGEIVENREQAEKAGHDVDEMLDILGFTEQEILDNKEDPSKDFLEKIKSATTILSPLGAAARFVGRK